MSFLDPLEGTETNVEQALTNLMLSVQNKRLSERER